jgi:hypothetical protein
MLGHRKGGLVRGPNKTAFNWEKFTKRKANWFISHFAAIKNWLEGAYKCKQEGESNKLGVLGKA